MVLLLDLKSYSCSIILTDANDEYFKFCVENISSVLGEGQGKSGFRTVQKRRVVRSAERSEFQRGQEQNREFLQGKLYCMKKKRILNRGRPWCSSACSTEPIFVFITNCKQNIELFPFVFYRSPWMIDLIIALLPCYIKPEWITTYAITYQNWSYNNIADKVDYILDSVLVECKRKSDWAEHSRFLLFYLFWTWLPMNQKHCESNQNYTLKRDILNIFESLNTPEWISLYLLNKFVLTHLKRQFERHFISTLTWRCIQNNHKRFSPLKCQSIWVILHNFQVDVDNNLCFFYWRILNK